MKNSTKRFSKTVQDYIKYRPSYPKEVLDVMVQECGLTKKSIIADVGSGTGFLSKLFLDNGNKVYGIEPNQEMREAAEAYLIDYSNFFSLNGAAEATELPDSSVDFVMAGTAFHWFDIPKSKIEFKRILKSPGTVLLVWNVRNTEQSNLMDDYEKLITHYGTDYQESNAKKFDKFALDGFFDSGKMNTSEFKNSQRFDWTGTQGRLLSTSYCPRPGDKNYNEIMASLKKIFDKYQVDGMVEFLYTTKLYYGYLK